MNIGILTPGFSAHEDDWAIPSMQNFVTTLATTEDLRVIALRYPLTQQPYTLGGARVYPMGFTSQASGWRRLRLWQATLHRIRRLHRERPFDVLHATWSDETGLLAAWAGRLLNIPTVTSITGGELVCFQGINYGSQCSRFGRWTIGQAVQADAVVVTGSHSQRLLRQAGYAVPENRLHRIIWGVDINRFTPPDSPRDSHRLLHVGSMIGIKNQAMLLQALARLDNVQLDLVGDGPLRPQLEQLAVDLGIAARVHFHGSIPYLDIPPYYQRACLYVMTSWNEGVPMTTLEAGACGLPTVSSAVGILPDYPELGVTVPVNDDALLAETIGDLLANDTPRRALEDSAYRTVRDQLSMSHTVQQYRSLYQQLAQ